MATTATTSTHTSPTSTSETSITTCTTKKPYLKLHSQPIKSKRRKCRETTISSAANPNFSDPPSVYLPRTLKISKPKSPPSGYSPKETDPVLDSPSPTVKIRFLSSGDLSKLMDFIPNNNHSPHHETTPPVASPFPSSFTKFNSALTAGLLNPMSPPPDRIRSSPTLFEMMASEPEMPLQQQQPRVNSNGHSNRSLNNKPPGPVLDKQSLVMQRISYILGNKSPGNQFNDSSTSDVKLTLSSKDGISVSLCVHRHILVAHSRFFAVKLSDGWSNNKQQQKSNSFLPCVVEIADCDDVEVYIETLRLMYCKDLRRMLMKEDVCKVLGILKVSAAIGFDAGVLSCLEYLEAAPWAEDEEEKVASLLSELHLEGVGAGEVLKRVSVEVANGTEEGGDNDEVLVKLLHVVLEGKDEKARREMKGLVSKMLRENSSQNELRKESLYSACDECMQLLRIYFLQAAAGDTEDFGQIARQADNLHWILDILIDRQIAEEFLKTWASQSELSNAHSKIPVVHRYEISRVTARLFIGIGKGQLLVSKEMRCLLLQTWLVPFYNDFGWMRRASKGLDRHLIEEGLSNTILTLPLSWQQEILLAWFDRFLNSGEDCPNIQRGFEVWWRRAFCRRGREHERARSLKIMKVTSENS